MREKTEKAVALTPTKEMPLRLGIEPGKPFRV
jgi:hypothetical protein